MRENFDGKHARQKAVLGKLQPQALIEALASQAAQTEAEADALQVPALHRAHVLLLCHTAVRLHDCKPQGKLYALSVGIPWPSLLRRCIVENPLVVRRMPSKRGRYPARHL